MDPLSPMEPIRSDLIPEDSEWVSQIKWDGVRILAYSDKQGTRLFNRHKRQRTIHYPELIDIGKYCSADSVILDGEVIALGADGKPDFHQVMRRDGLRRTDRVAMVSKVVPVTYMIFDVLFYNGGWLTGEPLNHRLDILSTIIHPNESVQVVSSHADGSTLFQVMKDQDMEGIVVKRLDSPYLIGQKANLWRKVKFYRDVVAVIGGFTLGEDGMINAVLLGLFDEQGQLQYIGHTGTGRLTRAEWRELTQQLQPDVVDEKPFVNQPERHTDAYWVHPIRAVKVNYAEWTPGRSLRQPSIQAFVNVDPRECVL